MANLDFMTALQRSAIASKNYADTKRLPSDVDKAYVEEQDRLIQEELDAQNDRIDVLEKMSEGILYDFVTQTVEGTQNIPKGSHLADLQKLEGKSIVFNQMVANVNKASSVYGITREAVRTADLLGIKYTGTSENSTNFTATTINKADVNWVEGHKMYYSLGANLPAGCRISLTTTDRISSLITVATSNNHSFGLFITEGTIVDLTCYPMCVDLTKMFGSGNEPTVEEFEAMFPNDYYPYNVGELQSVDNTKMVINGKNLLKRTTDNLWYYTKSFSDITITETGYKNHNPSLVGFILPAIPNTTYVYSAYGTVVNQWRVYGFDHKPTEDESLTNAETLVNVSILGELKKSFTTSSNTRWLVVGSYTQSNSGEIFDMQIELGDTSTKYSSYHEPTETPFVFIGKSAGIVRDELDLVNKKYIQRVGIVDLGSLSWVDTGTTSSSGGKVYGNNLSGKANGTLNLVSDKFWLHDTSAATMAINTTRGNATNSYVYVCVSNKSDIVGTMYYELAEPIITDVSEVIDSFNVEGNGSIEFDSSIPVKNTIEYLRYLNEVN